MICAACHDRINRVRIDGPAILGVIADNFDDQPPLQERDEVVVDGSVQQVGFVDVGGCGVSDRYLDLAVAARSLAHHVSPEALGPFFVEYGIDYPDLQKIDFYVLLDEFF